MLPTLHGMNVLTTLQQKYGASIEGALHEVLREADLTDEFAGMLRYQLGHVEADLTPTESRGGKRFRPVLCLLACEATGSDPAHALRAAVAIELLHNFSLIHDDIEDHDPERRHRPTVWKVWGEPHAINAGDAMFALAGWAMSTASDDPHVTQSLVQRFQRTTLQLTRGQYLDMQFESLMEVDGASYAEMVELKTGILIAYSLWAGACIGVGDPSMQEALWQVGLHLGKGFQIRDDIQGIWAESGVTGKEQGQDIKNRKKTLPVILATERANPDQARTLQRYYRGHNEDIASVYAVLDETEVRAMAQAQAAACSVNVRTALHDTGLPSASRDLLSALARELTN